MHLECATESATMGSAIDPTVRTTTMPRPLLRPVLRTKTSSKGGGDGKGKQGSAPHHACGEKGGQSRATTPDGVRKEERRKSGTGRDPALFPLPGTVTIRPGTTPKEKEVRARQDLCQGTSPRVVGRTPRETNGVRPDGRSNPEEETASPWDMVATSFWAMRQL